MEGGAAMIAVADLQDIFNDFSTYCQVQSEGEDAPRQVLMVTQALSSGSINSRNNMLSFIDRTTLPRGADWGYGLIWAQDAPDGMNPEIKMAVTDSTGQEWSCDSAKAVYDIDETARLKVVVAWRLVLRGKQRMVRGGAR